MSSPTTSDLKDGSITSKFEATTTSTSAEGNDDNAVTTTATGTTIEPNGPDSSSTTAKMKSPPSEQQSHIFRRSLIVASFWLLVLCLGIPIWWKTTAIYRASLPLEQMMNWADGKSCDPVLPIRIAIEAPGLNEKEVQNLVSITQHALDAMPDSPGHNWRLEAASQTSLKDTIAPRGHKNNALIVRLTPGDAATFKPASSPHAHLPVFEITYPPNSKPTLEDESSPLATYIAAQLRETFAEEQAMMTYFLAASTISSDQQPQVSHRGIDDSLSKRMTRSMKYSGTYHLTFSLFTDGSSPSSWDIDSAINQYMRPVLDMLKPIHNFTIDTQVQLYAIPGVQSQVLTKEDLSSFINAAEWPLSPSIGGAPTINFVVYAGNQTIGLDSEETSQSWLVPQWGSVYLLSPPAATHVPSEFLKQPVLTFASHLLSLLGTPQSGSLPMRLSTLARVRSVDMLLRASSSLGSLARLSLALPSISIPSSVADGVGKSIHHLELACSNLGSTESLEHARIAETEAERAFFEKSMVGQLYFPDEHKVAVYLPLLGPVGVPLLMGLLTEIKAWKTRKQQKVKAA